MGITNKLAGQKIVVIGGSSGIGFGAAAAFVAVGAHVTIISSSQEHVDDAVKRLSKVEVEIKSAASASVRGVVADVRDEDAFTATLRQLAPVDHVVFSAVDKIIRGPLADTNLDDAKHLFGVKFWGSIVLGKALVKYDIVRPGGSLTLTSGAAAYIATPGAVLGGALNSGVINLTQGLAVELASTGVSDANKHGKKVRVNTVVPGLVQTELWDKLGKSKEEQDKIFKDAAGKLSVGFVATPDEIAEAYLYAVRADYANGTVILIDGGGTHTNSVNRAGIAVPLRSDAATPTNAPVKLPCSWWPPHSSDTIDASYTGPTLVSSLLVSAVAYQNCSSLPPRTVSASRTSPLAGSRTGALSAGRSRLPSGYDISDDMIISSR
ncbi:short chain dehydrogenase [Ophiostoma piceae UAMH 11346]|uniref:Short chain dehydrogenase n=1 Tax=Ophiostoma piceae (strain UAMH 11346) TaxID=1262450 RepID=S3C2B0_OPHP1|nr:short chain dehydrogenase [Ophiostoma piceae UAMH 11346]